MIIIVEEGNNNQQQNPTIFFFLSTWIMICTLKEKQNKVKFQYITTLNQDGKHMQLIIYEPPHGRMPAKTYTTLLHPAEILL